MEGYYYYFTEEQKNALRQEFGIPEFIFEWRDVDPVRWAMRQEELDRELIETWRANGELDIQLNKPTNARLIPLLRNDAVRMVMRQYCLSREIAERIESLCWKDKHAHMDEYFAFLPQLAQLVFESCWEAFHAS